jgi:CheY-like chemotaxis protein
MGARIDELRRLRDGLAAGEADAADAVWRVAQALRGSGGSFGFPELSAVAALVEAASPSEIVRSTEGLIEYLHRIRHAGPTPPPVHAEWLARAAAVPASGATYPDIAAAWDDIAAKSGSTGSALAARAGRLLGVEVADLSKPARSALRLVPEALMRSALLLPLAEDPDTVTVAAADPTLLTAELELRRLTGRRPVLAVAPPDELAHAFVALLDVGVEESTRRRKSAASDGTPGTVLVVDDDPGARLLARSVLEKSGYTVVEAGDGREALDILRSDPSVVLVIADLDMPVLDGLELIWQMRDVEAWSHIPVIVLTGETDELLETKLIEEGADDYLSKPFDPRMFVARVGATIRRAEV